MIPALMLLFIISTAGESATAAVRFSSMEACESARAQVLEQVSDEKSPTGAKVEFVAVVCVEPIKVVTI